ncbi:hypothetical protein BG61_15480 [Caballeronia glathei]|uniref:Uncharacterized protein n=1 Tax=Caballeronia glathei TaxID=60547 RepID=A0A069PMD4_9BURK|nr:hypothetical protein BG61_15480 [Caballeronia glathei]
MPGARRLGRLPIHARRVHVDEKEADAFLLCDVASVSGNIDARDMDRCDAPSAHQVFWRTIKSTAEEGSSVVAAELAGDRTSVEGNAVRYRSPIEHAKYLARVEARYPNAAFPVDTDTVRLSIAHVRVHATPRQISVCIAIETGEPIRPRLSDDKGPASILQDHPVREVKAACGYSCGSIRIDDKKISRTFRCAAKQVVTKVADITLTVDIHDEVVEVGWRERRQIRVPHQIAVDDPLQLAIGHGDDDR